MPKVNTPNDVDVVFDALEKWIKARPGFDPANYSGAPAAYRSDMRSVGKQRTRALEALSEARTYEPDHEALMDSFRAFAGRLEWNGTALTYTTGQYYPTEYRAAAAAVLETYCSAIRAKHGVVSPPGGGRWTIADIKAANYDTGGHFFDKGTMRFFRSRVDQEVHQGPGGVFFVTSEQFVPSGGRPMPRKYSVRRFNPESGDIVTAGEFNEMGQYDAHEAARKLAAEKS
ncbi:MAG: hypothetical protein ABIG63_17530 [Chloroflexota bacterium]